MRKMPHRLVRLNPFNGTKIRVDNNSASKPQQLTRMVLSNSTGYGMPVRLMTSVPPSPMPRSMLSIGPPKQALKPMIGAKLAIVTFATKSPSELPTAKMVNPMIASERPKMRPNVCAARLSVVSL